MALPRLTRDLPGIGGAIKQRPEDFFVQEIPLYEPTGDGEHVYCEIEKVGISTFDAINLIAEALHISTRDIGFAGMKDAQAITRQVLSILGTTEEDVMKLQLPKIKVLWAARHGNKLRIGHLAGNRFAVKIREVDPTDVLKLRPILDILQKRGLPNYYGEQRFGHRNNNDQLGAALIRDDHKQVLKLLLGSPDSAVDDGITFDARRAFDQNDFERAMKRWPRRCGLERRILARFIKTRRPSAAVHAVDEKLRRLWTSALQSRLYNDVLAQRIDTIDRLMDGDLAWKHDNGACFHVESAAAEQARCDAFEISPSGPLVGYRVTLPTGQPLAIEEAVFAQAGLKPADLHKPGKEKVKGARRPLRVQPTEVDLASGVDEYGPHITVAFALPAGSFATVFLDELMKSTD